MLIVVWGGKVKMMWDRNGMDTGEMDCSQKYILARIIYHSRRRRCTRHTHRPKHFQTKPPPLDIIYLFQPSTLSIEHIYCQQRQRSPFVLAQGSLGHIHKHTHELRSFNWYLHLQIFMYPYQTLCLHTLCLGLGRQMRSNQISTQGAPDFDQTHKNQFQQWMVKSVVILWLTI